MEYCTKCGAKLPEKAEFCTKCGTPIKSSDEPKKEIKDKKSLEEQIEEAAEGIGKKAEQIGKRIEETADRFGKKIEKKTDDAGDHINQWYNKTFKIAGPLIGAFIGLIVLRIIIYVIQASGEDIFIATALKSSFFRSACFDVYQMILRRIYRNPIDVLAIPRNSIDFI